jgi:rod shape-determining protein MreC
MVELRFLSANAEIQNGDLLVTSGIDGTYPAGLPVASVVRIERDAEHTFAHVVCKPAAGVERGRYVLILSNELLTAPRPGEAQPGKDRRSEKSRRSKMKEPGKEKDADGSR